AATRQLAVLRRSSSASALPLGLSVFEMQTAPRASSGAANQVTPASGLQNARTGYLARFGLAVLRAEGALAAAPPGQCGKALEEIGRIYGKAHSDLIETDLLLLQARAALKDSDLSAASQACERAAAMSESRGLKPRLCAAHAILCETLVAEGKAAN